jgi:hypothetical protein
VYRASSGSDVKGLAAADKIRASAWLKTMVGPLGSFGMEVGLSILGMQVKGKQ